MAFLWDIERFFADLYPYRWPILALVFLVLTALAGVGVGWGGIVVCGVIELD